MSNSKRYSEGNKGSDLSYRGKVLKGLQKGADNTNGLIGVLTSILNATVAHQDMEILLVRDTGNGDQIVQQIREYDETSQTWSTTYSDISGAAYTPVGPLEYLDASAVLNLILTELLDQGLTLDDIELNTDDVATQTTLQALLTAFNAEDFATETTLTTVAADLALIYTNLQLNTISVANIDTKLTAAARTPGVLGITNTAGSTLGTWRSFTFVCVAGTVTIDGEVFPIGTYTFSNSNGTLTSIAYDASSSTDCKIIFVA